MSPPPPPIENLTLVATPGIDVLNGGPGNDTFISTNATLQNGDQFNGKEGTDQLDVAISGSAILIAIAFNAQSQAAKGRIILKQAEGRA